MLAEIAKWTYLQRGKTSSKNKCNGREIYNILYSASCWEMQMDLKGKLVFQGDCTNIISTRQVHALHCG